MRLPLIVVSLVACLAMPLRAQRQTPEDLEKTLTLVAKRVEEWHRRAQNVVSREAVVIQPLGSNLLPSGIPRHLVFELRVGWHPDPAKPDGSFVASVLRERIDVEDRSKDRDRGLECMDPKPVSMEPLAMFLSDRVHAYEFSMAGRGREERRAAVIINFRERSTAPPVISWTGTCVTLSLPGRLRGRVWVDAATYDVLRIDDYLVGTFTLDVPRANRNPGAAPTLVVERAESSIRYRQVSFEDPQETLTVPSTVETLTVIRGISAFGDVTNRTRITQRFSDYRRFLTGGRIVD